MAKITHKTDDKRKISLSDKNKPNQLIVNQVVIKQTKRTTLDVKQWRDAIQAAESVALPRRSRLYDIYEDCMLDTHLSSEIDKRIMAITNSDIVFVNSKGEEVPEINDLIDTMQFEELLKEIMLHVFWGISVIEFQPGIKVFQLETIPRKNIRPNTGVVVFDENTDEGINYREGTYLNWILEVGKPKDLGLLVKLVFWVIIKRGGIGDFAQMSEIFGMPMRVGEYDVFDEQTRIELTKAMEEMGSASYIVKPKGSSIELLENKSNNDGSMYDKLISICDSAISISVLGQTLTTIDKSGSGQAQGRIHQDTKEDISKGDKRTVRRVLNNGVCNILRNLGYPVEGGKFIFRDQKQMDEKSAKMKLFADMRKNGVPVADDYIYEQVGVPKPEDYDLLKEEMKRSKAVADPNALPDPKVKKKKTKDNQDQKSLSDLISEKFEALKVTLSDFFV